MSVVKRKAAPRRGLKKGGPRPKNAASSAEQTGEGEEEEDDEDREEIDPNEPTYCVCGDVSFGTMIACENEDVSRPESREISWNTILGVLLTRCLPAV